MGFKLSAQSLTLQGILLLGCYTNAAAPQITYETDQLENEGPERITIISVVSDCTFDISTFEYLRLLLYSRLCEMQNRDQHIHQWYDDSSLKLCGCLVRPDKHC